MKKQNKVSIWNPDKFPTEDYLKESSKQKSEDMDLDTEKHFASKGITEYELPAKPDSH